MTAALRIKTEAARAYANRATRLGLIAGHQLALGAPTARSWAEEAAREALHALAFNRPAALYAAAEARRTYC